MESITNLYIEPTTHCNLSCQMCSRNQWRNEEIGHMELVTFRQLLNHIPDTVHRIFFGGVGEPLSHPDIIQMVIEAKATGRTVGLITNGTLLDDEISMALVDAQLDELWVSMDSMHEEGIKSKSEKETESEREEGSLAYSDERRASGDEVDEKMNVLENIKAFIHQVPNRYIGLYNTDFEETIEMKIGIAFVLMKSNLDQFKELVKSARNMGISEVKATHLIPYDISQISEICYERILGTGMYQESNRSVTHLDLPLMEGQFLNSEMGEEQLIGANLSVSILETPIYRKKNWCKFIAQGYVFVRWDGEVSPCVALLHDNHVVQQGAYRYNRCCTYGNVKYSTIQEIWDSEDYAEFRQRVMDFDFSPCVTCGPCDLFESNETDCEGSPFPTCGACLWAEGLFQCP